MRFIQENILTLLIAALAVIGLIRLIIRSLHSNGSPDVGGNIGKVMKSSMFRESLPESMRGGEPEGHFQKPDFSYDEEEEKKRKNL